MIIQGREDLWATFAGEWLKRLGKAFVFLTRCPRCRDRFFQSPVDFPANVPEDAALCVRGGRSRSFVGQILPSRHKTLRRIIGQAFGGVERSAGISRRGLQVALGGVYEIDVERLTKEITDMFASLRGMREALELFQTWWDESFPRALIDAGYTGTEVGPKTQAMLDAVRAALSGIEPVDEQARGQGRSAPASTISKDTTK